MMVYYFALLFLTVVLVLSGPPGTYSESCDHGDIRLTNSTTPLEGRVELCLNGEWGTVCDNDWDTQDAIVVCRQVAQKYGVDVFKAVERGNFFRGQIADVEDLPIHGSNVRCLGVEEKLIDCPYETWGCSHYEDAGVSCILTNSSLLPACSEELRNYTGNALPLACPNDSCVVDVPDYSDDDYYYYYEYRPGYSRYNYNYENGHNQYECNGVTECGDCSDECHCEPDTVFRSSRTETCRIRGATITICECNSREWQCANGYCVHESWLCNGRDDCGDASDEQLQLCYDIRDKHRQTFRDNVNLSMRITYGASLGIVALLILIWLAVCFGWCVLSSQCRRLVFPRVRTNEQRRGVSSVRTDEESGEAGGVFESYEETGEAGGVFRVRTDEGGVSGGEGQELEMSGALLHGNQD